MHARTERSQDEDRHCLAGGCGDGGVGGASFRSPSPGTADVGGWAVLWGAAPGPVGGAAPLAPTPCMPGAQMSPDTPNVPWSRI